MIATKIIGLLRFRLAPEEELRGMPTPKKNRFKGGVNFNSLVCSCGAMFLYDQVNDLLYCKNCGKRKEKKCL